MHHPAHSSVKLCGDPYKYVSKVVHPHHPETAQGTPPKPGPHMMETHLLFHFLSIACRDIFNVVRWEILLDPGPVVSFPPAENHGHRGFSRLRSECSSDLRGLSRSAFRRKHMPFKNTCGQMIKDSVLSGVGNTMQTPSFQGFKRDQGPLGGCPPRLWEGCSSRVK